MICSLMWWNGRHRGLKIPCSKQACGFESRHQHHGADADPFGALYSLYGVFDQMMTINDLTLKMYFGTLSEI